MVGNLLSLRAVCRSGCQRPGHDTVYGHKLPFEMTVPCSLHSTVMCAHVCLHAHIVPSQNI